MRISEHEKFINELRTTLKSYNKITFKPLVQNTEPSCNSKITFDKDNKLINECGVKFDVLFGSFDD